MFAFLLEPGRSADTPGEARACSNCSQVVSAASMCGAAQYSSTGPRALLEYCNTILEYAYRT